MEWKYMTIEREYGSGGTEIARLLSAQTNTPCYGREILEEVSREQNIPVEQIEDYEETVTNSFLYSIFIMSQAAAGSSDMLSQDGHIYLAEQDVIRKFASEGPAIFLGHCAIEALRDRSNVVTVFIRCSDENAKRLRTINKYGIPVSQADSTRKKFDKKRANYYSVNTGRKWDDYTNYDIVLDSGKLGIDGCVEMLKALRG